MPFSRRRAEDGAKCKARPGKRRWLLAALIAPPAFWLALVVLLPTGWARRRIVAALGEATGRSVQLGEVRVGLLGGVSLLGLEIGEPGAAGSDPWLKADRLDLNTSLLQVASGRLLPTEVRAEGVSLRLRRRPDGSLEIGDLCRAKHVSPTGHPLDVDEADPPEVAFFLTGSKIRIVDDPSGTSIALEGVEGQGTWQRRLATISSLKGQVNGGTFDLSAALERQAGGPSFEGRLQTQNVGLSGMGKALAYLTPVLAEAETSANGRLDLDLYLRGRESPKTSLWQTLTGRGRVAVDPIQVDGSEFLADLARALRMPPKDRAGSMQSDFEVGNGRVSTKNLTLKMARIPVVLSGWTAFDGTLDYRVKTDDLAEKIAREAKGLLDDLPFDLKELAGIRVRGDLEHLTWTMGETPLDGRPGSAGVRVEDRIRMIGKHLKDKLRR